MSMGKLSPKPSFGPILDALDFTPECSSSDHTAPAHMAVTLDCACGRRTYLACYAHHAEMKQWQMTLGIDHKPCQSRAYLVAEDEL